MLAPVLGFRTAIVVLAIAWASSVMGGTALAAPPPAPTPVAPANGAPVTLPFSISWSVTDPVQIGGYNWEISRSTDFTSPIERNLTLLRGPATTTDKLSGLAPGTYFWRVQAVSRDVEPGAWSSPRSVVVTGASSAVPGEAVLDPPANATQFHSWENITFTWSAVPGAVSYILQESIDPAFPVATRVRQVDIPGPTERISFHPGIQGTFKARVIAVGPDGLMGAPSNTVDFSVLDANPFPAAPTLVAPAGGASQQLPIALSWTHVPNHDELGYQLQISNSSSFSTILASYGVTENRRIVSALPTGAKFWRVRSQHGYIGSNPAYTAWSAVGSFTILSTPLRMGSVSFPTPKFSGGEARGGAELTGPAPAGGAVVTFTSSNPALTPELPDSRTVPAGSSDVGILVYPTGFSNSGRGMQVGFVTTPTPVTVTASYNGSSVSTTITVLPPALNDTPLQLCEVKVTGGASTCGILDLEVGCFAGFCDGLAPPGGFDVSLSSSSPDATVPATFTLTSGQGGNSFPIETAPVTSVKIVTITATAGGRTTHIKYTLTPAPPPDSLTLRPATTSSGSQGVVLIPPWAILGHAQVLRVSSGNAGLASVPTFVTVPASTEIGRFDIATVQVDASTVVPISVTGGGVTRSADLTIVANVPALTALTVSPTSVTGGATATGTVTLGSAAPAGGVVVSLGSNLPGAASVPATVTVPGGATSATFPVTTSAVDTTTVQLSATLGSVTQFASLTVTRAASPALSAVSLSPSTVVGGSSSTGTVSLSAAAPSGGTVVSLSDNSAAATVPASVTVAAGSTSRTFTVTTSAVSSQTLAVVTASSGGVSRSANLTVNPPTPVAPTLETPANGATGLGQPITLQWNDVPNATSYEVRVDDSSAVSSPYVANPTVTASQATFTTLPGRQLWWRVRARNAAGVFGPLSSTFTFTPVTTATLSALAVSPANVVGGSGATGTVTLSAPAPSAGALVTLTSGNAAASVPTSVSVAAGSTTASFAVSTSAVATPVTVTLTAAWNGISRAATLTVNPPGTSGTLVAPTLLAPAADARFNAGQTIVFDWGDVSGAANYTIQIDDQSGFSSPSVNQTVAASTYSTSSLPVARHWFRVRANAADGTPGAWSAARRFEVR